MKYEEQQKLNPLKSHSLLIAGAIFIVGALVLKLLAESQSRVDY